VSNRFRFSEDCTENPRRVFEDYVHCEGTCGGRYHVDTQNTMRPQDWPVCATVGCPNYDHPMTLPPSEGA